MAELYTVPVGDSQILTKRAGGEDFSKALGTPGIQADPLDEFTPVMGRIRHNADGALEMYNGAIWVPYVTESDLDDAVEQLEEFVINGVKSLTKDFEIAVSNTDYPGLERYCDEVRYFTDTVRSIRLNDYLPEPYKLVAANDETIQDVILDDFGDLIFMAKNNAATTLGSNILFVRLVGCQLVNNFLTWQDIKYAHINNVPRPIHSLRYDKGFLFACTRINQGDINTLDTRLFRINAHDFTDVKIKDVDHGATPMRVATINVYKGEVYFTGWTTGNRQYLMKASGDLSTLTQLALTPANIQSVADASAFIVYRDYLYIPYSISNVSQGFQKNAGVAKYDLYGNFVTSALFKDLPTANGTFFAHWMTVFNDRIIITPSGQASGDRSIYRIKLSDLSLEESKQMAVVATNNNSITSDGFLIYNEELAGGDVNTRKIKYNDFTNDTILFASFSSSGSLDPSITDDCLDPTIPALVTGLAKTYIPLIADVTDSSALTGTTAETLLKSSYQIDANKTALGTLDLTAYFGVTGTAGIKTIKIYRNNVNTFGTATLVATLNIANTSLVALIERKFTIKTGNILYGLNSGFNSAIPGASGAAALSITYNPADAQYWFVTGQLANAADSLLLKELELTFKKSL